MPTKNKNNRPKRNKNKTKRNKTRNRRTLNRRIKKKIKKRTRKRTKRYRNVNLIKQIGGRTQHIYGNWYLYTGTPTPGDFGTATYDYLYDKTIWKVQTPPVGEGRGNGFIFINDISFVESANPPPRVDKLKDILKYWPAGIPIAPYGTTDEALRDPNIVERLVFEIKDHTGTLDLPIFQGGEVEAKRPINCGTFGCAFTATVTSGDFSGDLVIKQQCNPRNQLLSYNKRKSNEIMIMEKIRQSGGYLHILELKGLVENMPKLNPGKLGSLLWSSLDREDLVCETIAIPPCIQNLEDYLRGQLSESDIFTLIEQVLDAILFLHSIGILHGDISINNIMECYSESFGGNRFKLIDFGSSIFVVREDQKEEDFKQFNEKILMLRGVSGRNVSLSEIHGFLNSKLDYRNNSYLRRGLELPEL